VSVFSNYFVTSNRVGIYSCFLPELDDAQRAERQLQEAREQEEKIRGERVKIDKKETKKKKRKSRWVVEDDQK